MKGNEKIAISTDELKINGLEKDYVMHIGEKSLMCKLAEITTANGGDILEIGFGMHLSADAVQSNPNVTSHTIIEVHPEIYQSALTWSKNKPNTQIIFGDWVDVLPKLDKKFDGVLHDTHHDENILNFLDYIKPNCKKGTIISFFDFPKVDTHFNSYRHILTSDEIAALPYIHNRQFKYGYELKYTTFDGKSFVKNTNIKSLI